MFTDDFIQSLVEAIRPMIRQEIQSAVKEKKEILPDKIRIREAGQVCGYSVSTLYSKVCRGELPEGSYYKIGGKLYFSRKKLELWMQG